MTSKSELTRREFVRFMGRAALVAGTIPLMSESCARDTTILLEPLAPTLDDDLVLAKGFTYDLLIKWGDVIGPSGETFGFNNDYTAFLPRSTSDGLLWVNHEYVNQRFVSGFTGGEKTKTQVQQEQLAVGGSLLQLRKEGERWRLDPRGTNYRITAQTPIDIISDRPIVNSNRAIGTLANCAGGVTPWGTILTCEENYQHYYGEVGFEDGVRELKPGAYGWEKYYDYPPEHYGWVVEVNPQDLQAKKLTALGRFAHECATVREGADGRCAVYTGDDADNECLYKFIAEVPGSLNSGTLYVADLEEGRWVPVDINEHAVLQQSFSDQTEVLVRCREAAHLIGGTPLDRPEDIEIDPQTGSVIIALTNNIAGGNYHGSLLRITEQHNDPFALAFEHDTFKAGGAENGFACPDNLAFDPAGNLWITSDISGSRIGSGPYEAFGNNGLYFIPMKGEHAGEVVQVASAPVDAEFTGPFFAPDGRTLFLSVQHPGERSSAQELTSHWPDGGTSIPRPSVVTISGPALNAIIEGDYELES